MGFLSRAGGLVVGLLCGAFTTPWGEAVNSCNENRNADGSVPAEIYAANIILTPFRIAFGPIYAAYRGARYGFWKGLAGSMDDELAIESWDLGSQRLANEPPRFENEYHFYTEVVQFRPVPFTTSTVMKSINSPKSPSSTSTDYSSFSPKNSASPTVTRSAPAAANTQQSSSGFCAWFSRLFSCHEKPRKTATTPAMERDSRFIATLL